MAEKLRLEENDLIADQYTRLQNTRSGYRWRTIPLWNSMSVELRAELSYPRFKRELKKWILKARPPNEELEED